MLRMRFAKPEKWPSHHYSIAEKIRSLKLKYRVITLFTISAGPRKVGAKRIGKGIQSCSIGKGGPPGCQNVQNTHGGR